MFDKIKQAITGDSGTIGTDAFGGYGQYLQGIDFPIGKEDLILKLQDNGAGEAIVEHVQSLARDHFDSAEEVFATILPN
ncbi:MAG: DUF2795 domain-containing protein [Thermomicrobiales bacterium]